MSYFTELRQQLNNPENQFRAVPFWSWNDLLEEDALRQQIREFKAAGCGGFFMHARGGLKTPYLGEDWMEATRISMDEARKVGLEAWAYDEEGWPSGFAGGKVTAMGPEMHLKWIEMEDATTELEADPCCLGVYLLDDQGGCTMNPRPDAEGRRVVVRQCVNPCYVDTLNKGVIDQFIRVTHEAYGDLLQPEDGRRLMGFFTDEPQFARDRIPWSAVLPEAFETQHGYSILSGLPALFTATAQAEAFRHDFWQTVSALFTSAFCENIYNWHEAHGMKFTGHLMSEIGLEGQMGATAGVMPSYRWMHEPGVDWLGRRIDSPLLGKQLGSAAEQTGKTITLTETFALCGWNVSLEELRWMADWQFANGVKRICSHLSSYSLRGARKRDYPPSFFPHQPWWPQARVLFDYFARMGVLLTQGREVAPLLVLHPLHDAWGAFAWQDRQAVREMDEALEALLTTLTALGIPYHLGDETLMADLGRVDAAGLTVGGCTYQAVLIPAMKTLEDTTVRLFNAFAAAGGLIMAQEAVPEQINGRRVMPEPWTDAVVRLEGDLAAIRRLRPDLFPEIARGEGAEHLQMQWRRSGYGDVLFLANASQETAFCGSVTLPEGGNAMIYDAMRDTWAPMPHTVTIPAMGSLVVMTGVPEDGVWTEVPEGSALRAEATGTLWQMTLHEDNSLLLDTCQWQLEDGPWQPERSLIQLQEDMLALRREAELKLRFRFEIQGDPSRFGPCRLAMENPGQYAITLNGTPLNNTPRGFWKDQAFACLDTHHLLVEGENTLELALTFRQRPWVYHVLFGENVLETEKNRLTLDTELESLYLVGRFGVRSQGSWEALDRDAFRTAGPFVVGDLPNVSDGRHLERDGLLFYAGNLTLTREMASDTVPEQLVMHKPAAALASVRVNEGEEHLLPWQPFAAGIRNEACPGENTVSITLYGTNRNLLGPHHHQRGEVYQVTPGSFGSNPGWGSENHPGQWRDDYAFVRFGL